MTTHDRGRGRTGRPVLDRERIVRQALEAVDEYGAQGLTMRGLGQALGVEAMSLYRYVSGREDLLEAVVAHLMDDLDTRLARDESTSWQGYLQTLAHEVRRVADEHPRAFPLVATRHPAAPWLRPPLRSIGLVEHFLSTLAGYGFTDGQLVATYRAFSSFLLGSLLLETSVRADGAGAADQPVDQGGASLPEQDGQADVCDAPTVLRLREMLSEDRSAEEFEVGLETLLDRLEASLSR